MKSNIAKRYEVVGKAKAEGSTYTPVALSEFVAQRMMDSAKFSADRPIRILDPAIGHGELLSSLLSRLSIKAEVFGFETDEAALRVAESRLQNDFPDASINFEGGSFLDHALEKFGEDTFFDHPRYDLIIANPPYVRTQIIGADRAQLLAKQFGLSGRVDLYHAFLLGIARVLEPEGTAGIIVSNRFMTTRGGAATRAALLSELRLQSVFDLGDTKLFDAAVLPAVLIAHGKESEISGSTEFTTIYETSEPVMRRVPHVLDALAEEGVSEISDGRRFKVERGRLDNGGSEGGVWRRGSETVDAWLAQVAEKSWCEFKDIGKIKVGVKTTADKIFLAKMWYEELELLRPVTTHHVGRRYCAAPLTRKILYPHEVVDGKRQAITLTDFPLTRAYLEANRAALEARSYLIEAGRAWYELWVPQNPAEWQAPKLVFRDISEKPIFWMDRTGSVVNGDCYWLSGDENLLWLALAVANSTFIERFYDCRFNNKLYAGRRRFITQYVENFPIPHPDTFLGQQIISRARALYHLVEEGRDGTIAERELDNLVWKAFGCSIEEA